MTAENASVRAIREGLEDEWIKGVDEGLDASLTAPVAFISKPYHMMTPRQRGFIVGRNLREHEATVSQWLSR
jgi:hypothetical protein